MKKFIDPETQRYRQNYPKFPGVDVCVDLFRRPNVSGGYFEAVFYDLQSNAVEHIDQLIATFKAEPEGRARTCLLEILAEIASPKAFDILVACLNGPDEDLWGWAARGLHRLNTKESRRALWEAKTRQFDDPWQAECFQKALREAQL